MNHEEVKAIALNRGDVKAQYDALEAELALLHQTLAVRQAQHPRQGWDEQFRLMAERGDDQLLDGDTLSLSKWNEQEWEGDDM